ncbi:catalase family protein [uncultured Sphingomonas sp.]|uniref:catalase family protein n=1 Tax=uncultured Sphingomonas sp. TaxID=158754 RepID=UPI0035C991B8
MTDPLAYSPDIETVDPGEPALFDRIAAVMRAGGKVARDGEGPGGRISHVSTIAALKGEVVVLSDLAPELAQGIFVPGRRYPVVARMSHLPGEDLDQRGVSSHRGLSIKLFGVPGALLGRHTGDTQDFVLENAPAFNVASPAAFLLAISTVEAAAPLPQGAKVAVSAAARGLNRALGAVGVASANLDILGHPRRHPLSEAFHSQAPLRWGAYVAKLAAFPGDGQPDLPFDADAPDALRRAAVAHIAGHGATFTLAAQLWTDASAMPIEDASIAWPETLSPHRPVAILRFPPQDAAGPARIAGIDALSFSPAHAIEAHRPLGGIMRSRLALYTALSAERRRAAGLPLTEPSGPDAVAD